MKTKVIQIPIYNGTLQVLFGDISEVKNTLIEEYKVGNYEAGEMVKAIEGSNAAVMFDNKELFLWVNKIPTSIEDYGFLIHELQHATFRFLDNRGMSHTIESDEAYSYLIGYLFCEIDMWITELRKEEEQNTNN